MEIEMVADWAIDPFVLYQSSWEGPAKHAEAKPPIRDIERTLLIELLSAALATAHS